MAIFSPPLSHLFGLFWPRRRSKASTLPLPFVLVVFRVRHHSKDEHFLALEEDPGSKAIFVSTNVEYGAVADEAGGAEIVSNVAPCLPSHGFAVHVRIPGP